LCTALFSRLLAPRGLCGEELAADDQFGEGARDLPVGFQVGLDVLLHGESDVGAGQTIVRRY
jgi:hypothetical protein